MCSRRLKKCAANTVCRFDGIVRKRPEGTINTALTSGEIEVLCQQLTILNASVPIPFQLDDDNLSETTRLTHRVLDLRRPDDAEEHDAALSRDDGSAQVSGCRGLHRHRNADADAKHTGRRARLPRAVARAPWGLFSRCLSRLSFSNSC